MTTSERERAYQRVPILVLGLNRSGTKWLCNEIARHPDVVAVAHDDHGGVLESNLLTEFGMSFDFGDSVGYKSFLDFWEGTHFFNLAGGQRHRFEEPEERPVGPVEAFRRLMDDYARERNARYWVQKVGPTTSKHVCDRLPDAHLVLIRRDALDVIRSKLKMDRRRGLRTSVLRVSLSIMAQRKELRALCKERSVLEISFDELKYDRDQARGKISRFVGLRDADWSGPEYTRNTSFETDRDRMSVIGVGDLIVIRTVQLLFAILPQQTVRGLRRRFSRATTDVIPGTYRHIEHDALI